MQGILVQCMTKLEREERGILSNRGRKLKSCSDAERSLLQDAALSLSIAGGNKALLMELKQNVTKPKILMESLPEHGLPNPALSLMSEDQVQQNLTLIDQFYPRSDKASARRLILAMDATYLLRATCQYFLNGKAGVLGGCWSTVSSEAFLPFDTVRSNVNKAPVMQEFLCWDPCGFKKRTLSLASMPMSLAAPKSDDQDTLTHAGNMEMLRVLSQVLEKASWLVKGIVMDGHHSHRYVKECLLGSFNKVNPSILSELPFWKEVTYKDLPKHCLPRLPLRLCFHDNEAIWLLGGPCTLVLRCSVGVLLWFWAPG